MSLSVKNAREMADRQAAAIGAAGISPREVLDGMTHAKTVGISPRELGRQLVEQRGGLGLRVPVRRG